MFSLLGLLFHAESWSRSQELWRISAVADAAAATLAVLAVPKKVLWNPSKSGPQFVIEGVGSHDHILSVGETKGCRDQVNKNPQASPPQGSPEMSTPSLGCWLLEGRPQGELRLRAKAGFRVSHPFLES